MKSKTKKEKRPRSRVLSEDQKKLAGQWSGLVPSVVDRMRSHYLLEKINRNELLSEANDALIRAAIFYDPHRGFAFSTYATATITRAIFSYAKNIFESYRRGRAEIPMSCCTSGKIPESIVVGRVRHGEKSSSDDEDNKILTKKILDRLPVDCAAILRMRFIYGHNLANIGQRMGVSSQWVRELLERSIEMARKVALEIPVDD